MTNRVNPAITKEVMEEYEKLRKRNVVNMSDMNAVYTTAMQAGFTHLASLVLDDLQKRGSRSYIEIIVRYNFYMEHYKLR